MEESAGRYCPHCGAALGLKYRVWRRCGGSSRTLTQDMGAPPTSTSSGEATEEAREER